MRHTPGYLLTDRGEVKRLIRENPWATFVSATSQGLVASHYPVLLEEGADGISIVSHFGRPDEQLHELGRHQILVIIQGPHGYISPSWYGPDEVVPTWNHVTAHLYGTPELLSDDENFRVLTRLVDHFENDMPHPVHLHVDEDGARRVAKGTVGLRLKVERFDARLKLSQNKTPEVVGRIIDELQAGENYSNHGLAREMRILHRDEPRT
jgi:transcriptional regulator